MAIISDGTTIADAGAFSASLGSMILIKTITLSSAAGTIDFLNGASDVVFDGTYPIYKFVFTNMHPAATDPSFGFQVDVGTGTSYAQTITSTAFTAQAREDGNAAQASIGYQGGYDLAQATGFQQLIGNIKNNGDHGVSGELTIFSPSSGTFVKHFISKANTLENATPPVMSSFHGAGYVNTTTALTRIRFKMGSGNIDAGTIKMYGIKDS